MLLTLIEFTLQRRLDGTVSHIEARWWKPDRTWGREGFPLDPDTTEDEIEALMAEVRKAIENDPF